jgi:hypothetical protein
MWTSVFAKDTRWISFISGSNSTFDGSKDSSRQYNSLSVPCRRRQYGVWLHDFFSSSLFLLVSFTLFTRFGALVLYFCVALVVGGVFAAFRCASSRGSEAQGQCSRWFPLWPVAS